MNDVVKLDGSSLTRVQLVEVARGAQVALDAEALKRVARAADFLAAQVAREEPIYGVSTGFGSNADKLLGAHPLRDELPGAKPSGVSPHIELQRNLIVTHAVCVGEAFAPEVVRAMLLQRVGHGIDQLGGGQHAEFDGADAEIVEAGIDLRAQEFGGRCMDRGDAARVLGRQRGNRGQSVHAMRGEGLEVGLDAGAAAGIGAGDRQDGNRSMVRHAGVSVGSGQ